MHLLLLTLKIGSLNRVIQFLRVGILCLGVALFSEFIELGVKGVVQLLII